MPLNKLAQSLTGTCRHCGQKTGILQRIHPECRRTHQAGIQEMTQLATQAAAAHTFNETALRQTLGGHRPALPRHPARTSTAPWRRGFGREWPRR